jgi:hypothetical protein
MADRLLKTYALVCMAYGLSIDAYHIPGVQNCMADILSRDLVFCPEHALDTAAFGCPSATFIQNVTAALQHNPSRSFRARTVVMASIFRQNYCDTRELFSMVTLLTSSDSYPLSEYCSRSLVDSVFLRGLEELAKGEAERWPTVTESTTTRLDADEGPDVGEIFNAHVYWSGQPE